MQRVRKVRWLVNLASFFEQRSCLRVSLRAGRPYVRSIVRKMLIIVVVQMMKSKLISCLTKEQNEGLRRFDRYC